MTLHSDDLDGDLRRWRTDVPRKGFVLVDVIDLGRDYSKCEMCGHAPVRYQHHVLHTERNVHLRVGCICAEKLTEDYGDTGPAATEKRLKSAAAKKALKQARRRQQLENTCWRKSKKGHWWAKIDGKLIVIVPSKREDTYRLCIDGEFGRRSYLTQEAAQEGAREWVRAMIDWEEGLS